MELALQTGLNAAVAISFYCVMAVGLALIFGVMRVANFAHGEFYMVGAYIVWILYARGGLPFGVALLAAMAIVTAIGLACERGIFRPVRGNVVAGFIMSIGLVFILQVLIGRIWGLGLAKPVPPAFVGSLNIFGAMVGWQRFIMIPAAVTMMGLLWFFLRRFKLGRAVRAVAQDPETAALQGISINKIALVAMGIAAAFAGVAGALMSPIDIVDPYMGHAIVWIALMIVIVGGTGSLEGALIAAIIFGTLHTVVTTLADSMIANIIGILTLLTILAFRPKGILGREEA